MADPATRTCGRATGILVVDDDPETRRLVRTWFDGQPYEMLEASDGAEGLQMARSERPDLSSCWTSRCRAWTASRAARSSSDPGHPAASRWCSSPPAAT